MFGIVTNALVMRMLPTDPERNAYVLALSIVSLGAVVGTLGLPKTVVRLIAESMRVDRPERARQAIRTVLGLGIFGTLGISLAYLLIGDFVGNLLNSPALVALTGLTAGWISR
jgi:O-antigen/teichoic acid export membrane protein